MKKFGEVILIISIILLFAVVGFGGWYFLDSLNKSNEKIKDLEGKISNNVENRVDDSEKNTSDKKDEKNSNDVENKKEQKLTEEEMYKSVIDEYKKAISEFDIEEIYSEENIEKKYNLVSSTLIAHVARYKDSGVKLTYSFYDIDKNGIKELIVGASGSAGAIYSYDSNTNKPVKICYQDTMERGSLQVYDNGIILSEGSGGAALHYYRFGKITADGSSFETIEDIEEEYIQENSNPVYRDYKANKVLNYKNLNEIKDKYLSNSKVVEFSNYIEM